ncbi:hypothetical protein EXIGLDRAFT_767942, partial [Exidia glandulosa HHB12029]
MGKLTRKKGSRPPSKSPVPPDSEWVDEEDIATTGPREDDLASRTSTDASLTAESNSTFDNGTVDQSTDFTPEPVQEGRLRRSNRTTTAPESYATQRNALLKTGATVIKPKPPTTRPAAAPKSAPALQADSEVPVVDQADEDAEFTALTRRALPKKSASTKSSTTASTATAKPSANAKSTKRFDNSLRGNLPRDKEDAMSPIEEIPDSPEAASPSLVLSQRPSRAASKVANERLPAILELEPGSDSDVDAFEPHINVDESDYDELGSVDSGDEDEEDDEDSRVAFSPEDIRHADLVRLSMSPVPIRVRSTQATGSRKSKKQTVEPVRAMGRPKAAVQTTYMLKVPRKGQTEKKTLEVEKDLHWTAFRAHVLLAMCLVTTQEEASAYPATQAP